MSEMIDPLNNKSSSHYLNRRVVAFTIGGVLLGIGAPKLISGCWNNSRRKQIAKDYLNKLEKDTETLILSEFTDLNQFFITSKKNIPSFVDEALGYYSKWKIIIDNIPYTSGGTHEKFIREKFEEIVLKPNQLEKEVRLTVTNYLDKVSSMENRMLVDLRADIPDISKDYFNENLSVNLFQEKVDKIVVLASVASTEDISPTIVLNLASIIAGEALTAVAIQMGVSSGILTTGAVTGWATFGIGLVVSLIVDQIIGWLWNWYADPKGMLIQKLITKLNEIFLLVTTKLREELKKNAGKRDTARRNVILDFLSSAPG